MTPDNQLASMPMDNETRMRRIRERRAKEKLTSRTFSRIRADKLRYAFFEAEQNTDEKELLNHTIETYGMLQPLSVCGPYSDGTYKIVDGARRFAAFREMPGTDKILFPCYIVEKDVCDEELQLLRLAANISQKESSKAMVFAYVELYETRAANGLIPDGCVSSFAAKDCNMTTRHINIFRGIWRNGSQEIIDAVSTDSIPIKVAYDIVTAFPGNKEVQNAEALLYAAAETNNEKKAAKARLDAVVQAAKAGEHDMATLEAMARKSWIQKLANNSVSALHSLLHEQPDASAISPELINLCRNILEAYG